MEINRDKLGFFVFLSFLVITIFFISILASVPPVSRDALTHHLFIPKLYLAHGGIYEIPEYPWSYYPMNLDLLYLFPLYFKNDIVPKYIHFLFALLTALLIYTFLKNRIGRNWALFGSLFFLTIPVIIKLSITVYVDLGLIFFSTASLVAFIRWTDRSFQWKYLVISGLCAGLAAGTKYNGLITIFIISLFIPFFYSRITSINNTSQVTIGVKSLQFAIVFIFIALLTCSPWYIRNLIWSGNPLHPLQNQIFVGVIKGKIQSLNPNENSKNEIENLGPSAAKTNVFAARKLIYGETAWQTLTLPIRLFFEGQDDNPRFFDGKLSPFLLLLTILALLGWRSQTSKMKREISILFSFGLLYFLLAFFQSSIRVRYISPSLPPLVILSTIGFRNLHLWLRYKVIWPTRIHIIVTGILAYSVLSYNYTYLFDVFQKTEPLGYLLQKTSRDEYILSHRPEYSAIRWLNEWTTNKNRVLCLFLGNRGYYMEFSPIFYNPYVDKHQYDPDNFDYVLIRDDLFQSWVHYDINQRGRTEPSLRFGARVFTDRGYSVYSTK